MGESVVEVGAVVVLAGAVPAGMVWKVGTVR
jgi:hypothetical protein